jgi:amino acid adenylation domain-containing protein
MPKTEVAFVSVSESAAQFAARSPQQPAVTMGAQTITYGELNVRANRLAHYLRDRGVGSGSLVGLCIDRSIEYVIGALGILKSGAAYVPLDPSYPAQRLNFILGDAQIVLVVASCTNLAFSPETEVVLVGSDEVERQQSSDPAISPEPDELAYVIYTSGTTGEPKGVELTHRGLSNLVGWHRRAFQISSDDRSTLIANIGFDAAVWELWPHLSSGCTFLIPSGDMIRDPDSLRDWFVERGVTISFVPTLIAEILVQMQWPAQTRLRTLLTGGDVLHNFPSPGLPFDLINNYGPTECTVVSSSGLVPPLTVAQGSLPDIGQAIDNVQIHLLDEEFNEVPSGGIGEVFIGGDSLARGYLRRPELTGQCFPAVAIGGAETKRLYRTGDLGRLAPSGAIQYIGRTDTQVKIKGYRIECGEIESALNRISGVEMSVVIAKEFGPGDRRLVAFLVTAPGAALSRDELQQELKGKLPSYMVPGEFVRIETIPVTENGKVDRRRLATTESGEIISDVDSDESVIESELLIILKKLLGVEHIGRHDNFFMLGGHSFMAAQVIARIRSHFCVELTLRTIFDHPSPAAMAGVIEKQIITKMAAAN